MCDGRGCDLATNCYGPRPAMTSPPPSRLPLLRFLAALLPMALAGCGGPMELTFTGTSRAPGIDGKVRVERLEGGNSWVTFDVKNLPPPPRFGSGMRAFVVWVQGVDPAPVKAGSLDYQPDARQGFVHFTTPFDRFVVRLTVEQSASRAQPAGPVLAEQRISVE